MHSASASFFSGGGSSASHNRSTPLQGRRNTIDSYPAFQRIRRNPRPKLTENNSVSTGNGKPPSTLYLHHNNYNNDCDDSFDKSAATTTTTTNIMTPGAPRNSGDANAALVGSFLSHTGSVSKPSRTNPIARDNAYSENSSHENRRSNYSRLAPRPVTIRQLLIAYSSSGGGGADGEGQPHHQQRVIQPPPYQPKYQVTAPRNAAALVLGGPHQRAENSKPAGVTGSDGAENETPTTGDGVIGESTLLLQGVPASTVQIVGRVESIQGPEETANMNNNPTFGVSAASFGRHRQAHTTTTSNYTSNTQGRPFSLLVVSDGAGRVGVVFHHSCHAVRPATSAVEFSASRHLSSSDTDRDAPSAADDIHCHNHQSQSCYSSAENPCHASPLMVVPEEELDLRVGDAVTVVGQLAFADFDPVVSHFFSSLTVPLPSTEGAAVVGTGNRKTGERSYTGSLENINANAESNSNNILHTRCAPHPPNKTHILLPGAEAAIPLAALQALMGCAADGSSSNNNGEEEEQETNAAVPSGGVMLTEAEADYYNTHHQLPQQVELNAAASGEFGYAKSLLHTSSDCGAVSAQIVPVPFCIRGRVSLVMDSNEISYHRLNTILTYLRTREKGGA